MPKNDMVEFNIAVTVWLPRHQFKGKVAVSLRADYFWLIMSVVNSYQLFGQS